MGPSASVRFDGRVLYLTQDPELLRAQLAGERTLRYQDVFRAGEEPLALISNVSTDEVIPSWACYYYDETLARYCLVGLRGGAVQRDAIRAGGFSVIVSGASKGCGSSRETAPYSELKAGVKLVVAPSIEKSTSRTRRTSAFSRAPTSGCSRASSEESPSRGASSRKASTRSAQPSSSTAASSRTTARAWKGKSRRPRSRPPLAP